MSEEQKDTTEKTGSKIDFKFNREFIEGRLRELWEGKIPLVQTFWIYYFIAVFALTILAMMFGGFLGGILRLISLCWAGFMVMPVIRSADKYEGDQKWQLLARIAAALMAIIVAAGFLNMIAG